MIFTLHTDMDESYQLNAHEQIEAEINRMTGTAGAFICIEPDGLVEGSVFMQVSYLTKTKGFFVKKVIAEYYQLEVQIQEPNGDLYLHTTELNDKHLLKNIMCDYFEKRRIPNISTWERELFYKNKN